MSQENNQTSSFIFLEQNQIQEVKYPDLSTYIPPPSYNTLIFCENKEVEISQMRFQFLYNFYKLQAKSFLIVLVIQILGLEKWFMQISTRFTEVKLMGYYQRYEQFKIFSPGSTYDQYETWRQDQQYIITQVRWTLYVILGLLILNTLAIVIGRFNQNIVRYQKSLFYSQAVLIGLSLVGYTGKNKDNYYVHKELCKVIIITNSILLLNSFVNLLLIKIRKLNYYNIFATNLIYLQIPLNFFLILQFGEFSGQVLLYQTFVIYGFYYFNQLNHSLLINPEDLPAHKDFIKKIKEILLDPATTNNMPQPQEGLQTIQQSINIERRSLSLIGILVVQIILICLICLICMIGDTIFGILLLISIISLFSFLFETQVASKSQGFEDKYIAASMVYIDILSPLKNLLRSIEIKI